MGIVAVRLAACEARRVTCRTEARIPSNRRQAWPHVILFFAFPPDVRKVLYTTNALNKPDTAGDGNVGHRGRSIRRRAKHAD